MDTLFVPLKWILRFWWKNLINHICYRGACSEFFDVNVFYTLKMDEHKKEATLQSMYWVRYITQNLTAERDVCIQ